jgi:hypothetical protein
MTMTRSIRYAVVALAVVVCAWFVIGIRQVHAISAATKLLNNVATERSPAVQAHARSLLDEAAFLQPGVDVTLRRVQLAQNARDWARAGRLMDQATAAEPDNLDVWFAYLQLRVLHPAFGNGKLMFGRLHQLDPLDVYKH